MYDPDLPETLEFTFVRRWYCGVCGERRDGWGKCLSGECTCESDGWTAVRHLQFWIQK